MPDDELLSDVEGSVLTLTLNRPSKRNALSAALRRAIAGSLAEAEGDGDISAVVLTGSGGHFCAGFDLEELGAATDQAAVFHEATAYHHAVHNFTKPLIASITGSAMGGGLDLALMCDLRVCSSEARFGQPQVRHGIPAAFELLREVIGDPAARDLCLTGRRVNADEALKIGLVSRVVDGADPIGLAMELALDIAGLPGTGVSKRRFVSLQPNLFDIG